jgi:cyclohexanone monooxygenase
MPIAERPDAESPDVIIVGAGFAGMYAIYRLRELGFEVVAIEAGSDVGGTWYWNRYPGARCDVPSLEYSFGFSPELEQEWDWPEVFSSQADILRYANHVADRFDLRRHIAFARRVVAIEYQDDRNVWQVRTDRDEVWQARFVVMATGCLSVPNWPDLPGAGTFQGQVLHTGLWPKEPVDLTGKRVGIIGTGSSGVQAIPELAREALHLTVFQRTPVYTIPANRKRMRADVQQDFRAHYRRIRALQQRNAGGVSTYRPFHPELLQSVPDPGGAAREPVSAEDYENDPVGAIRSGGRRLMDLLALDPAARAQVVAQGGLGALLAFGDVFTNPEANEVANALFREGIRTIVKDPEVAERLAPKTYGLGCKRQVLDRDFYETFNRGNVTLVDLAATPIRTLTPTGVRTSADEHPLDVLIYATGFDAMTGALRKANIRGRDGRALDDKWAHGPVTFLGLAMAGFPNLFTITGPGSPSVLCNMLVAIEQHVNWIGDCLVWLRDHGMATIEATPAAEDAWVAHVNAVAEGTMYTAPSCNSWYLGANIPGKPRIFMPYVGGYPRYRRRCEEVAASGYEGFALG